MKYRLPIILVLLITLPLFLLAWQSYRLLNNEKAIQQAQFTQLAKLRQQQSLDTIHAYFEQYAKQWQSQIPQWSLTESSLHQLIRQSPKINQLFLIGTDKKRIYPSKDSNQHAKSTSDFIQRMQTIWDDPERLFSNDQQYDQESQTTALQKSTSVKHRGGHFLSNTSSKIITKMSHSTTRSGWAMWHWESSIIIIYWYQYADGKIIGIELNTSLLMADIIALLPDSNGTIEQQHHVQRLLNSNGQIVYEWGDLKLNLAKEKPLHSLLLPYPLSTWKLEYFAQPNQQTLGLMSLLLLVIVALLLFAMGYYLYREHNREVRLASQRVSFVSQVSHELKTPLTNIRLYAEMLENSLDEEPKSQQYSQIIVNESQRLTRLINNILSFSRRTKVHLSAINVDEEIRQTVEYFIPSFKRRNLQVNFQLNANQIIHTDSDGLDQIVNNLLSNVEKYAVNGQYVDIITKIIPSTESPSDAYFILKVRDYGKGIAHHAYKNIFKPFYRVDDHITEGVSGTGIGLTIARQQAERMGATLSLIPVDQGACFEFKLPLQT